MHNLFYRTASSYQIFGMRNLHHKSKKLLKTAELQTNFKKSDWNHVSFCFRRADLPGNLLSGCDLHFLISRQCLNFPIAQPASKLSYKLVPFLAAVICFSTNSHSFSPCFISLCPLSLCDLLSPVLTLIPAPTPYPSCGTLHSVLSITLFYLSVCIQMRSSTFQICSKNHVCLPCCTSLYLVSIAIQLLTVYFHMHICIRSI